MASTAAIAAPSAVPSKAESKLACKAWGHWASAHKACQTVTSSAGASAQYSPGNKGPRISATGRAASHTDDHRRPWPGDPSGAKRRISVSRSA
ncbi:MAG: hypothetical protein A3G82_08885 [Burkholderiales bacterium RIFCSPLOWO2_12_FULL_67_210]|nr:MAG: hypothetical protein A3G82_08885 [Burkholderiales bacterium RIFCSPLOWO2_12_FULL_67_210]